MLSDKRDFNDFTKFPGRIENNLYTFPPIIYKDSKNKSRIWTIFVRLITENSTSKVGHKHNWDLNIDNIVPLTDNYLETAELPEHSIAQYWVETGIVDGKISRHPPSYGELKNKSHSNERNSFKQALSEARSKYLDKLNETGAGKLNADSNKSGLSPKYFPMLAKNFNDEIDKSEDWFPCYAQPKLDGVRCLIYLEPHSDSKEATSKEANLEFKVILYTRTKKEFQGFDYVRETLFKSLKKFYRKKTKESLYLDGEFYRHGRPLQDISGEVRNIEKNNTTTENSVQYYMFDCFYPSEDLGFEQRYEKLTEFYEYYTDSELSNSEPKLSNSVSIKQSFIMLTPTIEIESKAEFLVQYKKWLKLKYEGIMYRSKEGKYLKDATKTGAFLRSKDLLKLKMRYSDEFEIVNFTQGTKGRDKNAILWICKAKNSDKTFHVTPKNTTLKDRYALYTEVSKPDVFKNQYLGKLLTIEYEDLSKDKIPLRAKSIGLRDYE